MQWSAVAACTLSLQLLLSVLAVDIDYDRRVLAFYYVRFHHGSTVLATAAHNLAQQ